MDAGSVRSHVSTGLLTVPHWKPDPLTAIVPATQRQRDRLAESAGKQRREALGASLLAVYGMWQCEGDVRHLVAYFPQVEDAI